LWRECGCDCGVSVVAIAIAVAVVLAVVVAVAIAMRSRFDRCMLEQASLGLGSTSFSTVKACEDDLEDGWMDGGEAYYRGDSGDDTLMLTIIHSVEIIPEDARKLLMQSERVKQARLRALSLMRVGSPSGRRLMRV
jgi:hypothetical protein